MMARGLCAKEEVKIWISRAMSWPKEQHEQTAELYTRHHGANKTCRNSPSADYDSNDVEKTNISFRHLIWHIGK